MKDRIDKSKENSHAERSGKRKYVSFMKIDMGALLGKLFLFLITLCFFFILAYYLEWSIKELLREDIPPLVKIGPLVILIGMVSLIIFLICSLKEQKEASE